MFKVMIFKEPLQKVCGKYLIGLLIKYYAWKFFDEDLLQLNKRFGGLAHNYLLFTIPSKNWYATRLHLRENLIPILSEKQWHL